MGNLSTNLWYPHDFLQAAFDPVRTAPSGWPASCVELQTSWAKMLENVEEVFFQLIFKVTIPSSLGEINPSINGLVEGKILTGNQPDFPMISMGFSCIFSLQNQSIEKGNYRINQENCGYVCDHFWRTSLEVGARNLWPSNDTMIQDWLNKLQKEKADWWTARHLTLIGDELQLLPWNSAWYLEVPPQLTLQHDCEILPSTEQAIENNGEFQWN